jgi:3-phenylpropionate/cinnamic acid dioxygenase small subunit
MHGDVPAYAIGDTQYQTEGEGQPNIFWEDQDLMWVRIRRNTHPNAWSQGPRNRLCQVVSAVVVERADHKSGDIVARSHFHCADYLRYEVRNFTGRYRHALKKTTWGYRIELQRVDLVNREGPFDYVMQWWL